MNTTVTDAGTNMSGNQQRTIKAAVRDTLTEQFQQFDGSSGDQLETNLQAFLADIKAAAVKHSAKAPKLFSSASTYALGAVSGKKTKKCCTGKLWYYRDGDFDNWLSADQPNTDAGIVTVLTPMKDWTFAEAAVSVLNVSPDTSVDVLGKLLKERRHTMTLAQAEAMTEATERGEKTGMVTNGWGNFFFVENADGSVSVASWVAVAVIVLGTRTSTSFPATIAGTPAVASWSATWILRNSGSKSLYSDFQNVPLLRLRGRGTLFILQLNTLASPA